MAHIKTNFLQENMGKLVKIIYPNGFQLRGKLVDYDEEYMSIRTSEYGGEKDIPVLFSNVTTIPMQS